VATALAVKDDAEHSTIKLAARASSAFMAKYFSEEMAEIVDAERKVSHEKLAEKVEAVLFDEKLRGKFLPSGVSLFSISHDNIIST
jgi:nucleosome binding factor SPN SPT16 subunit